MEELDFNKMLIKDSEFYNPDCSYTSILKKNNIITISQLLNEELITEITKRCHAGTRYQLETFISMVKYKYLNIPLCNDVLLEKNIIVFPEGYVRDDHFVLKESERRLYIPGFLGCHDTYVKIMKRKFIMKISRPTNPERYTQREYKIIDFLYYLRESNPPKKIQSIIDCYIEAYENKLKINTQESDFETISTLRTQLTNLVSERDSLDVQIANLQKQIDSLSNVTTRGESRK